MSKIPTYNLNNNTSLPFKKEDSFNLEAHTTSNMKLERPKVSSDDFNIAIDNYNKYSHKEITKHLDDINKDVYQRAHKEKVNHDFNFKRYFTIFGILGLLTAAIAYFRKGK